MKLSEKMFARAERMRKKGRRAYAMFLRKDAAKVVNLEAENEVLKEAGRGLVNALPDLELEIAEEGWGVTNANVVRHWRDKLDALLTGESDETE